MFSFTHSEDVMKHPEFSKEHVTMTTPSVGVECHPEAGMFMDH